MYKCILLSLLLSAIILGCDHSSTTSSNEVNCSNIDDKDVIQTLPKLLQKIKNKEIDAEVQSYSFDNLILHWIKYYPNRTGGFGCNLCRYELLVSEPNSENFQIIFSIAGNTNEFDIKPSIVERKFILKMITTNQTVETELFQINLAELKLIMQVNPLRELLKISPLNE